MVATLLLQCCELGADRLRAGGEWLSWARCALHGPDELGAEETALLRTALGLHAVLSFAHAVDSPVGLLIAACRPAGAAQACCAVAGAASRGRDVVQGCVLAAY